MPNQTTSKHLPECHHHCCYCGPSDFLDAAEADAADSAGFAAPGGVTADELAQQIADAAADEACDRSTQRNEATKELPK